MTLFNGAALWVGIALALVACALVFQPLVRGATLLPPDDDELEARIRAAAEVAESANVEPR